MTTPEHDNGLKPAPGPEGERTVPSVNRPKAGNNRLMQGVLIAVAAIVAVGMLYLYLPHHKAGQGAPNSSGVQVKNDKGRIDTDIPQIDVDKLEALRAAALAKNAPPPPPAVLTTLTKDQLNAPPPPGSNVNGGEAQAQAERDKKAAEDQLARRQRSPLLAFGGSANQEGGSAPAARPGAAQGPMTPEQMAAILTAQTRQGQATQAPPKSELDTKLTATKLTAVSAAQLGNRDLVITEGTFLDATLETALDSTVPGFTKCILTRDIYSDSGRVVLLERGTKLVGQYSGGIKQGEARIFALWTRAETPRGVVINLGSPGTDGLGAAGVPGFVDTHFWARFGGALLVSVVNDAFTVLASSQGAGVQGTSNTQGTTKDAASIAMENSINIPPTLYKNQGDKINIIVARDLDFSSVYGLRLSKDAGNGG